MTYKGAIRWENAVKGQSTIKNSVISSGRGMGLVFENSANVEIKDTTVADFIQQGIWIQNSNGITVDGAWVHHIIPEVDIEVQMHAYPILQTYAIGGITASQGTRDIIIRNSIVSGSWHHGFHFIPRECDRRTHEMINEDNPDFIFENNIAHTISGYGAVAAKVNNRCTIVQDFKGYKCTQSTIHLAGAAESNVGRNLVSIDSRYGIGVHSGGDGDAYLYESRVYGENPDNQDCPTGSVCDHCLDSVGIVMNQMCARAHLDA